VVDEDGRLLGRITIDDVVDVIREEADHSLVSLGRLGEEDTFSPVISGRPATRSLAGHQSDDSAGGLFCDQPISGNH
jgi:hypothetical protein